MNPFAAALLDYHAGDTSAAFIIHRDDGFHERVPAEAFFADGEFPPLEVRALDLCRGRVLDVGAAAGRHSLELLRRGMSVTSLDIVPEMEGLLRSRGAARVVISDVGAYVGEQFETLLLLLNGIGMVGAMEALDRFLQHAHTIATPGGQILCDSTDVSLTTKPVHVAYRERNVAIGRPPGQQRFTIQYREVFGEPFDWLHIDFPTLSSHASQHGWQAELIEAEPSGHYLCRLVER